MVVLFGVFIGVFEVYEFCDGDKSCYGGKGVLKVVEVVIDEFGLVLEGVEVSE